VICDWVIDLSLVIGSLIHVVAIADDEITNKSPNDKSQIAKSITQSQITK
jgi:hypothetical protein